MRLDARWTSGVETVGRDATRYMQSAENFTNSSHYLHTLTVEKWSISL